MPNILGQVEGQKQAEWHGPQSGAEHDYRPFPNIVNYLITRRFLTEPLTRCRGNCYNFSILASHDDGSPFADETGAMMPCLSWQRP